MLKGPLLVKELDRKHKLTEEELLKGEEYHLLSSAVKVAISDYSQDTI